MIKLFKKNRSTTDILSDLYGKVDELRGRQETIKADNIKRDEKIGGLRVEIGQIVIAHDAADGELRSNESVTDNIRRLLGEYVPIPPKGARDQDAT